MTIDNWIAVAAYTVARLRMRHLPEGAGVEQGEANAYGKTIWMDERSVLNNFIGIYLRPLDDETRP
jgi:hypothetical protein